MSTLYILAIFCSVGAAFDAYSYKNEKTKVYRLLLKWQKKIDKLTTPELFESTLIYARKNLSKIIVKNQFIKSLIRISMLSWLLTSLFWLIGSYFNPEEHSGIYLPWYNFYIPNLIFDLISITATYYIVQQIITNRKRALYLIPIDIGLSYLLLFLCWISFGALGHTTFEFDEFLFGEIESSHDYHHIEVNQMPIDNWTKAMNLSNSEKGALIDSLNLSSNATVTSAESGIGPYLEARLFQLQYLIKVFQDDRIPVKEVRSFIIKDEMNVHKISISMDLFFSKTYSICALTTFIPTITYFTILLRQGEAKLHMFKVTSVFHHLQRVGPK